MKILLPGGAGLVGQNLITRLKAKGYKNIVVIDKHRENLALLKKIHPGIIAVYGDLALEGDWQNHFKGANTVVMMQAQIGGNIYQDFVRNNIDSTKLILDLVRINSISNLIHISSSVVTSVGNDFYTNTKREQERIVLESNIPCPILRPTLMFGWFDRKHLGWLSRFMKKTPIFPIPGDGRYPRQPLYVGDFCNIIISCIENNVEDGVFNISGREKIDYIDVVRAVKRATGAKTPIVCIPYSIFFVLLWAWQFLDKNPPFTTQQLVSLVAKDEFEVIDWPSIFSVSCTSFSNAINETFNDQYFSKVVLKF